MDDTDRTLYATSQSNWPPAASPTVAQAFSDVDNPFMFQGRPHFAINIAASDTQGKLMLNDHRASLNDPVIRRWVTRNPLCYNRTLVSTIVIQPTIILRFRLVRRMR